MMLDGLSEFVMGRILFDLAAALSARSPALPVPRQRPPVTDLGALIGNGVTAGWKEFANA